MNSNQLITAWCWPVQAFDKRKPEISDGYNPTGRSGRGHWGVDIMFRRPTKGELKPPEYAPRYECPSGRVKMIAPADCRVLVAGHNSTGMRVQLDMGIVRGVRQDQAGKEIGRIVCYGTHMTKLFVEAGQVLAMGQEIGIVGADPRQGKKGLNHMHFEIWDVTDGPAKYPDQSIDPGPFMKSWGYKMADGNIYWPNGEKPNPAAVVATSKAVSEDTAAFPATAIPDADIATVAADAVDGDLGDL